MQVQAQSYNTIFLTSFSSFSWIKQHHPYCPISVSYYLSVFNFGTCLCCLNNVQHFVRCSLFSGKVEWNECSFVIFDLFELLCCRQYLFPAIHIRFIISLIGLGLFSTSVQILLTDATCPSKSICDPVPRVSEMASMSCQASVFCTPFIARFISPLNFNCICNIFLSHL